MTLEGNIPTISCPESLIVRISHWCRPDRAKRKHGPGRSLAVQVMKTAERFSTASLSLSALDISGLERIGGGLLGIRDWHRKVDTCDLQWRDGAPPFFHTCLSGLYDSDDTVATLRVSYFCLDDAGNFTLQL